MHSGGQSGMAAPIRSLDDGLARIAAKIDAAHLQSSEDLQLAAWNFETVDRVPLLQLRVQPPEWPLYPYRQTLDDPEKMLWNELAPVYAGVHVRDDRMLAVRANFGSGVVASLFGARLRCLADEMPWADPLPGREAIRRVVARGLPEIDCGHAGKVLAFERYYRDRLAPYPALRDHLHISQSDTQSPLTTAFLVWGADLYLAMRDEPALVHQMLHLATEATIAFVRAQKHIVAEPDDRAWHFWYRVPGGVRVVDDVSINLSPAMYQEFCRPYNQRVLAAFGGGYMHYCGHGLQSQQQRLDTRGLRGIEMGFDNPVRNPRYTLDSIHSQAARHRVAILWMCDGQPAEVRVETGLICGYRDPALPWAEAAANYRKWKERFTTVWTQSSSR